MRVLLIWIFIAGFSVSGFAQLTVHGVIRSGEKPVGYATIGIKGTTRSGMSNENGEFTLTVSSLPQTIIVSAIGFEVGEFNMITDQQTIDLKPKVYEMKEVAVVGDEAYRIFNKAHKKLMKSGYMAFGGKVFYRLVTQNDSNYTELMEGFYEVQANPRGFNYWQLKHGRYAIVDDYRKKNYVMSIDFSALVKYMNITNEHESGVRFPLFPFRSNAKSRYSFTREGYTYIQNKEVSKIHFTPNTNREEQFEGTAYIHEGTGNLHRLIATYSKPYSYLISSQYSKDPATDLSITYTIDFTEDTDGKMLISWVNIDLKYVYTHERKRTNVFTQIQSFVYEKDTQLIHSELERSAADKASGITKTAINTYNTFTDYQAIKSRFYVKPFWDENPVITQTALQQQITKGFEEKKSFGRAFNDVNDTLAVLQEGYVLLGNKENRLMAAIQEHPGNSVDANCIALTLNGSQNASLCSQLLVSYNCYKDSFYLSVLPVMDTTLTWMSDSLKRDDVFSQVFKLYSRLTAVYARQLKATLLKVESPCEHEMVLYEHIGKANDDLYNDQLLLINDLWSEDQFPFWSRYIESLEKEY